MKYFEKSPAVLLLEDGTVFYGRSAGKIGIATGEICFNTGMTGYQEVFTDPSYFGQIMVTTNVHVGNYGVHKDEVESDSMKIAGLVCRNFTSMYSRKDATGDIQDYFLEENMVAITDVDTRALVRHIRSKGAMNAIISSSDLDIESLKKKLAAVPSMEGLELVSCVSTKEAYDFGPATADYKVAVLDLGVKKNILRCLADRGCSLRVFPYDTSFEDLMAWSPDGFMISNGPGDPAPLTGVVDTMKQIIESGLPVFGICLGHQIIALANGLHTYKMHHGHRGINHPVKNLASGKCEITSQNHGFGVDAEDVKGNPDIEVTHVNLNDQTIEGFRLKKHKVFSVQYHPEASPGPHDASYLFEEFITHIKENTNINA
ncbi:MAG: glutamine-hydrolyzing carbamoyl-phosphate synthase small subunit [Flavobacteriales bacterium]|nr:glutamine-hydrolyzing carbamoyl-phosphate synthase small subunit [Flavobacteriales bacterium]